MTMMRALIAIVLVATVVTALPPNLREYLTRSHARSSGFSTR
jgi:hypothetical protein